MNAEDTLRAHLETLKMLNRSRFDYVVARSGTLTIQDALDAIGYSHSWYYKFSDEERRQLEDLSEQLRHECALKALYILEEAAVNAAQTKVDGLESALAWIKQAAATEILNRVVGSKPIKQEIEHTGTVTHRIEHFDELLEKVYGDESNHT